MFEVVVRKIIGIENYCSGLGKEYGDQENMPNQMEPMRSGKARLCAEGPKIFFAGAKLCTKLARS